MTAQERSYYLKARERGTEARWAIREARIRARWDDLEAEGLVKLELEPDSDADLSFLEQDHYTDSREGRACANAIRADLERDGAYGVVGYYRTDDESEWRCGGSVWGHIGYDDARDSCYTADIMAETIEALEDALARSVLQL